MAAIRAFRAVCLAAAFLAAGLGVVFSAADPVPLPRARPTHQPATVVAAHGQVILLRGLVNVFSLGMDRLAAKLRAKGIPARVTNHSHWEEFASVIATEYRTDKSVVPIVIIGHSLGADAAVLMGNRLAARGVPVRLVVAFDGVAGGAPVVAGVAEVVNYYKPDGWGQLVKPGPDYKGKLENVDLSSNKAIDHLNIDKSSDLHDEVIAKVTAVFAEKRK